MSEKREFIRREDWTYGATPHNPRWQRWFTRSGWQLCPESKYKEGSYLPVFRETVRGEFVMVCEDGQVYQLDFEQDIIKVYPSRSIIEGRSNAESIAQKAGGWK
jgi:hypothetical protein